MPVMCMIRAPGVTPADYDNVRAYLKWETEPPEGGLAHFITFEGGACLEVDIWESERAFRTFYERRFQPALRHFRLTVSEPEVLPLHNLALAQQVARFVLRTPSVEATPPPAKKTEHRVRRGETRVRTPAHLH